MWIILRKHQKRRISLLDTEMKNDTHQCKLINVVILQEVTTALDRFSGYHPIWEKDREEDLVEFNKEDPKLSEYEAKIKHYEELEVEINGLPEFYDVGPIALYTGWKKFSIYPFTTNILT